MAKPDTLFLRRRPRILNSLVSFLRRAPCLKSSPSSDSLAELTRQLERLKQMPIDWDSAKTPYLPQEIWDCIIDFVGYLVAGSYTALVCKAWAPRAQQNLYQNIFIRNDEMLEKLLSTLGSRPEYGLYIQSISFTSGRHGRRNGPWDDFSTGMIPLSTPVDGGAVRWPYTVLVKLTPFLTNLRQINASGHIISHGLHIPGSPAYIRLDSAHAPAKFSEAMSKHVDTLQVLRLHIASFATLTEFTTLALSFPRLRTLDIDDVVLGTIDVDHAISLIRSLDTLPKLDKLVISTTDVAGGVAICDLFIRSGLYKDISALKLSRIDCTAPSEYATVAGKLIDVCGPSLRELDLGLKNVMKLSRTGYFSFSSNTALIRLNIEQHSSGPKDTKRTKRLHWLLSLLTTIPSDNNLQTLRLSLNMPFNPHKTRDASLKPNSKLAEDFAQLDKLFISESFKNVKKIKWKVTIVDWIWPRSNGRYRGAVVTESAVFPLTSDKNILVFKPGSISYQGYMWDFDDPEPDSEDDV